MAIIIPCNHFHAFRLLQLMGILFYIFLSIFPFPFLISTSLFVRLRSSIDFYSAKVSQARNTANTGMIKKSSGRRNEKTYKKVENRDAQNKILTS